MDNMELEILVERELERKLSSREKTVVAATQKVIGARIKEAIPLLVRVGKSGGPRALRQVLTNLRGESR